ncbi:MAG: P-type conjugative transfer protein TrbJ [Zhongshania marina]|jgi:P-type conjugative transfer protein TrbJ
MNKIKILAAKILVSLSLVVNPLVVGAGIPVIDATALPQHILSAIENTTQTLQQIEEYRTQLQQYQDQIRNTMNPSAFIWDQASATINDLRRTIDTLAYYKTQLGSIDAYLAKFGDIDYYRNSACFNGGSCTESEKVSLDKARALASESQKKANDALFKGLDEQQIAIEDDAYRLTQLQGRVQTATGRMEALQYANQLASNQASQLLQLRGLMMAAYSAEAARQAASASESARSRAAYENLTRSISSGVSAPSSY